MINILQLKLSLVPFFLHNYIVHVANVRSRDIRSLNVNNSVRVVAVGDYFYYDEEDLTKAQMASINWEDWTIRNNLVSIGDTFNTCGKSSQHGTLIEFHKTKSLVTLQLW